MISRSKDTHRGFTLVEIVVMIAIIGILVTIGFVYVPQAIDRSKGATIATSIKQTRDALVAWHIEENWINWRTENELCFPHGAVGPSDNPKIIEIIENDDPACPEDARLQNFLEKQNVPGQFIGNTRYDNDIVGQPDNCSGQYENTTNLQIIGKEYFTYVNQIIDGDEANTKCGHVVDCAVFGYNCIAYILSFDADEVSDSLKKDQQTAYDNEAKLTDTFAATPITNARLQATRRHLLT